MSAKGPRDEDVALSDAEAEMLKMVAARKGISTEEAATSLVSSAIARRIKKKTGKTPAKVFLFPGR